MSHDRRVALQLLGAVGSAYAVYTLYRWLHRNKHATNAAQYALSSTAAELVAACKAGDAQTVIEMLSQLARDISVDGCCDSRGMTALSAACACGHVAVVELLMQRGAEPHRGDRTGLSAVHHAAAMGRKAVLQALCAYFQPDGVASLLDARRPTDGTSPLMLAAAEGHAEVVALLTSRGVDVDARTRPACVTALHAAAQKDRGDAVRSLIAAGASLEAVTANGRTPLAVAAQYGSLEAACAFLDGGACAAGSYVREPGAPEPPFDMHPHPLVVAARKGHVAVMRRLLQNMHVHERDVVLNDGRSLLLACIQGFKDSHGRLLIRPDVLSTLLMSGADPHAACSIVGSGGADVITTVTPLAAARASHHRGVQRVFAAWEAGELSLPTQEGNGDEGEEDEALLDTSRSTDPRPSPGGVGGREETNDNDDDAGAEGASSSWSSGILDDSGTDLPVVPSPVPVDRPASAASGGCEDPAPAPSPAKQAS